VRPGWTASISHPAAPAASIDACARCGRPFQRTQFRDVRVPPERINRIRTQFAATGAKPGAGSSGTGGALKARFAARRRRDAKDFAACQLLAGLIAQPRSEITPAAAVLIRGRSTLA